MIKSAHRPASRSIAEPAIRVAVAAALARGKPALGAADEYAEPIAKYFPAFVMPRVRRRPLTMAWVNAARSSQNSKQFI